MQLAAGLAAAPDARAALLTPTVQFPLGCRLSRGRWKQLLDWARASDAWILQDDYEDSLGRAPATPSLPAAAEGAQRLLHLGSFSNVLFPGLRLGYLVVPPSLVGRLEYAAALVPMQQSLLEQMALCDFIDGGHFGRHLARMRSLYAERRQALAQALRRVFEPKARVEDRGGMHLLLRLPAQSDDVALAAHARAQGLAVNALTSMSAQARVGPGLLLGYTNIRPEAALEAASLLRRALAGAPGLVWSDC
jgi:GntR family transcriptional regulator/MocR family aminotransferase